MRLPALSQLRIIHHSELRRRGGGPGFKGREDNSQEDEKSRRLVNRCLPCQANKLSLVIALFLV